MNIHRHAHMHMSADLKLVLEKLTNMKLKGGKETMTRISGSRDVYTNAKVNNNYERILLRVTCISNLKKSHEYMYE